MPITRSEPIRRRLRLLAILAVIAMVTAACGGGGDDDNGDRAGGDGALTGQTVEVMAKWTGAELESAKEVMAEFEKETGAKVNLQGQGDDLPTILSTRVEGGDPPDIAILPQPGLMADLAKRGALKPIEDVAGDVVDENYASVWRDLGSHDGELYGVWFKASNKSTVWYNTKLMEQAGAEPPETWEEWISVSGDLTDAGITPVAVGAADGWVMSDWFENVYLRTAGPEKYDQLAAGQLPWTDQSVKDALKTMAELIGQPQFVAKGLDGALQVGFQDSVKLVFGTDPEAATVFEGDFVAGVILDETDSKAGEDFDFFPFPSIDGSDPSVVGSGDVAVLFSDSEAAKELMKFLATPEAAEVWAERGGFSSPNKKVDLEAYPDDIARRAAQQLVQADTFRFDLSDQVPAALGAAKGAGIWGRLQDWMSKPTDIDAITSRLQSEAETAYKS